MSLRAGLLRQRCLIAGPSRPARLLRPSASTSCSWRYTRAYSTPGKANGVEPTPTPAAARGSAAPAAATPQPTPSTSAHNHDHESHSHDHDHGHEHSGLFHSHDHTHSEGAGQIIEAMRTGHLDRGTKITLLGQSAECRADDRTGIKCRTNYLEGVGRTMDELSESVGGGGT